MSFVEIIKLGFHGFAFVMLYLGFMLLRDVIKNRTANDNQDKNLPPILRSIYVFLAISFLFFVTGAAIQIYSNVNPCTVSLSIVPKLPKANPVVTNLTSRQELNFDTLSSRLGSFDIKNKEVIQLDIQELSEELRSLTTRLTELQNLKTLESSEGGL